MTTTNPTQGTDTGLTNDALNNYLDDMQGRASRLSGMMNAIAHLQNEEACKEGQATLIYLAEELAAELSTALDAVNRPEEVA